MPKRRIRHSNSHMNGYSHTWFETFLRSIPESQTDAEAAFLLRRLPSSQFPRVFDVCCGAGRHAVRLARAGYQVTGLDRDSDVLSGSAKFEPGTA